MITHYTDKDDLIQRIILRYIGELQADKAEDESMLKHRDWNLETSVTRNDVEMQIEKIEEQIKLLTNE